MMLRNSGKVFATNFRIAYKLLLYKVIVGVLLVAIGIAIFLPNLTPVFEDMKELGVIDMTKEAFENLFSLSSSNEEVKATFSDATQLTRTVLAVHSDNLMRSYIGIGVIVFLAYFLTRISDYPTASLIHGYMQYQARFSFSSELIGKFVLSLKYALFSLCILLPIDVAIVGLSVFLLIGIGGGFAFVAPFIASLTFILLFALRLSFSSVWLPCMVAEEIGPVAAFKQSLPVLGDRFGMIFSECLLMVIGSMTLFVIVGISTLGAALPLLFVAFTVFYSSFGFVAYFGVKGKRYYVDYETIVTPKKLRDKELNFKYDLGD